MLQNIEFGNHDEHLLPLLKKGTLYTFMKANPGKMHTGLAGSNYFGRYIQT